MDEVRPREAERPSPVLRGLRVGIMGGTFDPPHLGHLAAAEAVRESLQLDRIVFIPAATSPFKAGQGGASEGTPAELRLRMLLAAVKEDPYFLVSPLEIERGGISYTADTLRFLEASEAQELFLLMGADQWAAFSSWREPHEIARRARVVVMTRAGMEGPVQHADLPGLPDPLRVDVPRIDISSSFLRHQVRSGRSIRYLVPDSVRWIIEDTGLYLEA